MFDYEKIINIPITHTHENAHALTCITNIIHFYTIQRSGPIGLFSNNWAKGTSKYCG